MNLPRALGPYRLERLIGRGGMAEVYLATAFGNSGFEKKIALKLIAEELTFDARLERTLIEEAKLGARLSHPNLVGVHDLGSDEGRLYVRMDFVDGLDAGTLLEKGPLPVAVALHVGREVLKALEYLHSFAEGGSPLGLVHRDVSAANLLLSVDGEVKLADLGIAKATLLKDQTRGGIRKGKYAYMSPEQVAGEPLSARTDQFGFAITLAELLTGRRPFDADSVMQTMDRLRAAEAPSLDGIPPEIAVVLRRCLSRDPLQRFPSAREIASALPSREGPMADALGALVRGAR